MRLKKRNKRSRIRGTRTCGWAMKKHKGSGNRGGKGMAGTGKRGGVKISLVNTLYHGKYFGKSGITSKSTARKTNLVINVGDIQKRHKPGELDLSSYKILGKGEIKDKYTIKAAGASAQAIEKIEKAGGKVIFDSEEDKKEVKEETNAKKTEKVKKSEK